jgi:ferredoxin--NADP+ reductase
MDLSGYSALTLVERIDFADDLALFRLKAPSPVDFKPGQYATLGVMDDATGRPLLRPYSVASAPGEEMMEFFIERVDEGKLTPRLWELEEGADIWMRDKLVGRFVLDTSCRHHLMAATVTGVGPYVSIVRDQIRALDAGALETPYRVMILHGASHSWELGRYVPELTTLADKHDWLSYVPTVSRPWDETEWAGETGRVEDVLRKHLDGWGPPLDDTAGYTCGHPQMIDKAQGILERAGLPEDVIHEEKYFVERVSA